MPLYRMTVRYPIWETSFTNRTQPTRGSVRPINVLSLCVKIQRSLFVLPSVKVGNTFFFSS